MGWRLHWNRRVDNLWLKIIIKCFNILLSILFLANARGAPMEPYYGRLIGDFVEFAHKIKVSWYMKMTIIFNVY